MRTVTDEELNLILKKHFLWLHGREHGVRADLSDADLRGRRLEGVNLSRAILDGANLENAWVLHSNLSKASLRDTNLTRTVIQGTSLISSILIRANLENASLVNSDITYANLTGANLFCAGVENTKGMDFVVVNNSTKFYFLQCPQEGSFIGYKKANDHIVKLEICEDAMRSSSTTRKCRCSKAKVLGIEWIDSPTDLMSVRSDFDPTFVYTIGRTVEVKNFDKNRWKECAPGIHFFMTRDEAINY